MTLIKAKPVAIPATIGGKIDLRMQLKSKKEEAQKLADAYDAQMRDVERALEEQMEKEGTTKGGGKLATVSLGESVVPNVVDWDAFYKFIHKTKYYHLLERRPSVTGCRELFDTKGMIPGVVPFPKKKLNFTSVKE